MNHFFGVDSPEEMSETKMKNNEMKNEQSERKEISVIVIAAVLAAIAALTITVFAFCNAEVISVNITNNDVKIDENGEKYVVVYLDESGKASYQLEWEIRGKYGIAAAAGCGVFNGDLGIIDSINAFSETLTVVFDENRYVEYSFRQLDELELAYAVTVHKSQGSEYPAVVIPILSGPALLMTRNLIYTAVTRAKKCVVITGSRKALLDMIANVKEDERFTSLAEEIRELAEL